MKLLVGTRSTQNTRLFDVHPKKIKPLLKQVFEETDHDYALAMDQGRLFFMELHKEFGTPHRTNPEWFTTEIKYHPLIHKLM